MGSIGEGATTGRSSARGRRRGSYRGTHSIGGDATLFSFEGRWTRYRWPHKKKRVIRGIAGEAKVGYLLQYDSFMGMRGGIGRLLKMLLVFTVAMVE
jgi:hypothetical protein